MVVAELDVVGVPVYESKANSPLIIYRYRMLAPSVSGECMQPIAGRNTQVVNARSQIDVLEFSSCPFRHLGRHPPGSSRSVKLLGTTVSERLDHS